MKDDDLLSAQANIKYLERELAAARETLRDKFAMAALQGLYASYNGNAPDPDDISAEAYYVADSMLEARK